MCVVVVVAIIVVVVMATTSRYKYFLAILVYSFTTKNFQPPPMVKLP